MFPTLAAWACLLRVGAGLEPEFVGRVPVRVACRPLTEDEELAKRMAERSWAERQEEPEGLKRIKRMGKQMAPDRTSAHLAIGGREARGVPGESTDFAGRF
mgnify:CR=1 FL=1